jgi:hypothetical protein
MNKLTTFTCQFLSFEVCLKQSKFLMQAFRCAFKFQIF